MPKRYTGGVTDFLSSDPARSLEMLDPSKYIVYHEDFSMFGMNAASVEASGYYNGYGFSPAGDAAITLAASTDSGGVHLTFTNGTTDTTFCRVQLYPGNFTLFSGKKAFMEARFRVTAATIATHFFAVGLLTPEAAGDTSNIVDDTTFVLIADDSWCVFKDANQSTLKGRCGENDVNSDVNLVTTYVSATWTTVSCYFDGTDLYWYVDGALTAKNTPSAIPVTPVSPTFIHLSQKAEALVSSWDYLTILVER